MLELINLTTLLAGIFLVLILIILSAKSRPKRKLKKILDSRLKIKTRQEIEQIVLKLRQQNPQIKIITTNGAFDVLHTGHLHALKKARQYGDVLIIGLNSDISVKKYKSPDRPIIPQKERAEMLAGLGLVDYVVIFNETDPRELLKVIKPDFHVKSKQGFKGIEKDVVEQNNGKIILIDDIPGLSTTQIIKKISQIMEKEKSL